MSDEDFYVTTMPPSRPADYYLGYLGGCIFLDFDKVGEKNVCLIRISFDGHGCCELPDSALPLNEKDSKIFKDFVEGKVKDQIALRVVVRKAIALNKTLIWSVALEEYELI